jgi:hypothetical protein
VAYLSVGALSPSYILASHLPNTSVQSRAINSILDRLISSAVFVNVLMHAAKFTRFRQLVHRVSKLPTWVTLVGNGDRRPTYLPRGFYDNIERFRNGLSKMESDIVEKFVFMTKKIKH